MLTVQLDRMMFELDEGSIKNIGPMDKAATVKLFGVSEPDVREFGDKRIKLVFEDGDGNEVQVALFPDDAREIRRGIERLEDGPIFE